MTPHPFYRGFHAIVEGRSSGSRIVLLSAPSRCDQHRNSDTADFVPDYSGGTAPDFNGIPYQARLGTFARVHIPEGRFCQMPRPAEINPPLCRSFPPKRADVEQEFQPTGQPAEGIKIAAVSAGLSPSSRPMMWVPRAERTAGRLTGAFIDFFDVGLEHEQPE